MDAPEGTDTLLNGPVAFHGVIAAPNACARCGFGARVHDEGRQVRTWPRDLAEVQVEQHDWVAPTDDVIKARLQARRARGGWLW
jgi:hypothetical protein